MIWVWTLIVALACAMPFYIGVRRGRNKDTALLLAGVIVCGMCGLGALNVLAS